MPHGKQPAEPAKRDRTLDELMAESKRVRDEAAVLRERMRALAELIAEQQEEREKRRARGGG